MGLSIFFTKVSPTGNIYCSVIPTIKLTGQLTAGRNEPSLLTKGRQQDQKKDLLPSPHPNWTLKSALITQYLKGEKQNKHKPMDNWSPTNTLPPMYYCISNLWIQFPSELHSSQTCIVLPCLAQEQEELTKISLVLQWSGKFITGLHSQNKYIFPVLIIS